MRDFEFVLMLGQTIEQEFKTAYRLPGFFLILGAMHRKTQIIHGAILVDSINYLFESQINYLFLSQIRNLTHKL